MADFISHRTLWITLSAEICLPLMMRHLASQMFLIVENKIKLIAGLLRFLSGGNNSLVSDGILETDLNVWTTNCQAGIHLEQRNT